MSKTQSVICVLITLDAFFTLLASIGRDGPVTIFEN